MGLVKAKYSSTSQLVLLPPLSGASARYNGVANPYLGITGLQSMAAVVADAMSDHGTATALAAAGVTSYSVTYDSLSGGPILIATATEPTPQAASAAMLAVDREVPLTVARLQGEDAIAPRQFITAKVIARPSVPLKSGKTQLRIAALALVLGIVLTLLVISVIEGWRIRRQDRGSQADPQAGSYNGAPGPALADGTQRPLSPQN
jgi:hypothetical protein